MNEENKDVSIMQVILLQETNDETSWYVELIIINRGIASQVP